MSDPDVGVALTRPVTRRLLVDSVGFAPSPPIPTRHRPEGWPSTIVEICISGTGWMRMGGVQHRITAGTGFVIPAGMPHSYGAIEAPYDRWWCTVRGSDIPDLAALLHVSVATPTFAIRDLEGAVALISETLTGYELDQSPPRLLEATGAMWRLLTRLSADRALPPRSSPIERAMSYLVAHLDTDVSISDLAGKVGVSPRRLAAQFRAATGGGVHAYQVRLRMVRARDLLDNTDAAIADIAHAVGYRDPYYFSRHFRHIHGLSPTAFRGRGRALPRSIG